MPAGDNRAGEGMAVWAASIIAGSKIVCIAPSGRCLADLIGLPIWAGA
jgi:hypothetical protein